MYSLLTSRLCVFNVNCVAPENSLKTQPQTHPLSGRGFIISELSPLPQRGGVGFKIWYYATYIIYNN
jgi:hypothetical protein